MFSFVVLQGDSEFCTFDSIGVKLDELEPNFQLTNSPTQLANSATQQLTNSTTLGFEGEDEVVWNNG